MIGFDHKLIISDHLRTKVIVKYLLRFSIIDTMVSYILMFYMKQSFPFEKEWLYLTIYFLIFPLKINLTKKQEQMLFPNNAICF